MITEFRFGIILFLCFIAASCKQNAPQNKEVGPEKVEVTLRAGIKDSVWFVPGRGVGDYSYDTLKSTVADLPEVLVRSQYGLPKLTNVGDVDGDGMDEVGFFDTAYDSNWNYYSVYSVKDGCWCELKEKPYIYIPGFHDLNPQPRIIEPSGDGRIKILKMELDDDVIVGDTIVDPVSEKLLDVNEQAFHDSLITLIDTQSGELLDSALIDFLSSASAFNHLLDDRKTGSLRVSVSEDKLARLITIPGTGSMTTGESYIQYRRSDNTVVLKKVAYAEEMAEGGVSFPALFIELHNNARGSGYKAYGVFSFSSNDETFQDSLVVSKEFLESDHFLLK